MTRLLLAGLALLAATAALADDKDKLDGTWNLESRVTNGTDFAQATAFSTVVRPSASSIDSISCSKTPGPFVGQSTRSELRPAWASGRSEISGKRLASATRALPCARCTRRRRPGWR